MSGVTWNGDGSYTPTCELCEWTGKDRVVHSDAQDALRSHAKSQRHQAKVEIIRVDGGATCPTCAKPYREHPWDSVNTDYRGYQYLHIGCDGKRLKL